MTLIRLVEFGHTDPSEFTREQLQRDQCHVMWSFEWNSSVVCGGPKKQRALRYAYGYFAQIASSDLFHLNDEVGPSKTERECFLTAKACSTHHDIQCKGLAQRR